MPVEFPEAACCRGCDYLLRGLPSNICPECGRVFDRDRRRSYAVMPRRRRIRRRVLRIAAVTAALAILAALAPRGFSRGEITFKCKRCGVRRSIVRWEAVAAGWTGMRYPGWASRGDARSKCQVLGTTSSELALDRHDDDVVFRVWEGSNASGATFSIGPTQSVSINGSSVTEESAVAILDLLMNPNRGRIRLSIAPSEH